MIQEYQIHNGEDIGNAAGLADFFLHLKFSSNVILIKVNWCNARPGYFTDAKTLRFLIKGIRSVKPDARLIIIESYSYERNDPELEKFPERELSRKAIIRENEAKFLEEQGFLDLMKEERLEYINLTEEFWAGANVPAETVLSSVGLHYGYSLSLPELAAGIPEKIYQYKDCTLLDVTKIKGIILPGFLFFSLSMKNLFGLIPKTCRRNYHGKPRLNNAIIDMNVIFRSLFDVVGITEALFNTVFIGEKHHLIESAGCMAASRDLLTLDAALISSLSFNPWDRNFIKMSEPVFGSIDRNRLYLSSVANGLYPLVDAKIGIQAVKESKETVNYLI